jgi:hypothetical protein
MRLNGLAEVVRAADTFLQPSWLGPTLMHYCRQSDGRGEVTWRTLPAPAAPASTPAVEFAFPAAIGFLSQPDGEFTLLVAGVELLRFDVAIDDAVWRSGAGAELEFECREANREDAAGIMRLRVPRALVVPGVPIEITVRGSASGSQRWFGVLTP